VAKGSLPCGKVSGIYRLLLDLENHHLATLDWDYFEGKVLLSMQRAILNIIYHLQNEEQLFFSKVGQSQCYKGLKQMIDSIYSSFEKQNFITFFLPFQGQIFVYGIKMVYFERHTNI
jgi:hypothetical protein